MYIRPKSNWEAHWASRYALPYQPASPREWKSSVMRGTAVAIIVRSYMLGQVRLFDYEPQTQETLRERLETGRGKGQSSLKSGFSHSDKLAGLHHAAPRSKVLSSHSLSRPFLAQLWEALRPFRVTFADCLNLTCSGIVFGAWGTKIFVFGMALAILYIHTVTRTIVSK